MDKYVIKKPQVSDLGRLPSNVPGPKLNSQVLRLFQVKGIIEDQTKFSYAHMRITDDTVHTNEIHTVVVSVCPRAITAVEYGKTGNKHFHVFMELPLEYSASDFRKFRPLILELFDVKPNYSISCQRYANKLPSYVVKDGDYLQKGFTFDEMKTIESQSYKKYNQADYAKELVSIRQDYLHDIISEQIAIQKILDTRAKMKITGCSDTNYVVKKLKDWNCIKYQAIRNTLCERIIRELHYWERDEQYS